MGTGYKITISANASDLITNAEAILAKHAADGLTSPIKAMDMADFLAKTTAAHAKDDSAKANNRDKETAIQARDNAIGYNALTGSVFVYVKSVRDILVALYKPLQQQLGDWGFEISRSGGGISILIPKQPVKLIELAEKILAKNTLEGVHSPLTGLDIDDFTDKTETAREKDTLAKTLTQEKQLAISTRDLLCGFVKKQTTTTPGTILYYVTQARTLLLGLNKGNEMALTQWGFTVHHGGTPPPTPPVEICLTGKVTDDSNNPINNASIKIVQLNVIALSNADGLYSIPMQAAGTYTVEVSKTNYITQTVADVIIAPGQVKNINPRLISITGTVIANVYGNGTPLAGATVSSDALGKTAISDGGGVAVLNNVGVGSWNVIATATGKTPLILTVVIDPNTTVTLNFNLVEIS